MQISTYIRETAHNVLLKREKEAREDGEHKRLGQESLILKWMSINRSGHET